MTDAKIQNKYRFNKTKKMPAISCKHLSFGRAGENRTPTSEETRF